MNTVKRVISQLTLALDSDPTTTPKAAYVG
jgi:hypothetical protein